MILLVHESQENQQKEKKEDRNVEKQQQQQQRIRSVQDFSLSLFEISSRHICTVSVCSCGFVRVFKVVFEWE